MLTQKFIFFKVRIFPGKGRGIVATRNFNPKDFIVEYKGELIGYQEAKKRQKNLTDEEGNFMFFFKFKEKSLW